ncbi:hypothetical protein GCM10010464_46700 [Pseudonocardia yunnanensis]|uniref:Secreted protein n=1 Tax=Pseudonocardia yunnanensis TaxID=58107 RepID=A0ABW4F0C8_9PSEU
MSRPLVSHLARFSLATAAALLLTASLPAPARSASGDVPVTLGAPGMGGPIVTAPRTVVKDPRDGHCYTVREVFPDAPEGAYFRSVGNYSVAPVSIYRADACAGPPYGPTPLSYGQVVTDAELRSFKAR